MYSLIRLPFAAVTLMALSFFAPASVSESNPATAVSVITSGNTNKNRSAEITEKYSLWQLQTEGISIDLFSYAMKGYNYLNEHRRLNNPGIITIIDFSKPSDEKRLYILDVFTGKLLFKTLVAHGRNSGKELAKSFSNAASSFSSSLGFYVTSDTYNGKHGYSLRLNGCEKGFNDNAYKRAVVVHGADYVSESFIQQNGFLGRSHGCPAIPSALSQKIIDVIKDGSCLFIYSPVKTYLIQSALLKS
ncbi:MAG: murein L,D-transpeptidase catalytic domain family protein [Chitinophagaceae bacterium]|nr:murein L,D-transpeptidase catalytic domain family protein [Chitinophagaceae bacterium]